MTLAIMKCYLNDLIKTKDSYDSAGFSYRTRKGLFIIFDCFGETKV